ncbi:unnamed protein product (macronuclear) [Paramecium tetraurelia]|uniref:CDT1 Geminin-binding domain-containing protein n=1 Tax=Paramecium tetraurelia TaxID=5888 RepID=A0C3R4_PARTE|nr:uncharacterized protein GSPATT00034910001 [Paramecium tetraurelia]CAK65431.1 unnamed protein product [Paramecium tetraurelia]|eukprot:XP_001432828.1 hypothetical protein (macronuclear) [Paramecium tetraurelia strain d4-2]
MKPISINKSLHILRGKSKFVHIGQDVKEQISLIQQNFEALKIKLISEIHYFISKYNMSNFNKSPYVHTMIKCYRGLAYQDLIFFNDFGKRVVNFHGALERVSYLENLPQKIYDDYYRCEVVKIPTQSQFCFEDLKQQIETVIKKPYSSFTNNGSDNCKELLEKLNIDRLPSDNFDKKGLIA